MRGKKYNDDIKEKAIALLATNNNTSEVARKLNINPNTLHTWKTNLEKEQTEESKKFAKLREEKKEKFIDKAWEIIEQAQDLLERRIARALASEEQLDEMLAELLRTEGLTNEDRKALCKKMFAIKVEDISKLTTALGTLYDKQAVANGDCTSKEEVVIKKFEDYQ